MSVPLSDDSEDQAVYSGLLQTVLLLFKFTIGMGDLEYKEKVKHSYTAMLLVLLFVILTYILLLNMLIALMSETVTDVSKYSQSVWQLQRAIAILQIEKNRIWSCKKAQRDNRFLFIKSEDKKEERRFFRVEEVNWEDWTEKLVLKEEPCVWKSHQVEETMFLDKSSVSKIRSWVSQAMSRLSPSREQEGENKEQMTMDLGPLRTVGGEKSPAGRRNEQTSL